jgi:membrane protein DedA with SNARE-associated domain/membrane-associated phospholipid phosphatase
LLSYLHAVITFTAAHVLLAYGVVFLCALLESVPVIGLFIPGTLTIIALSALVPTGALDLWPLMGAAVLGAILGDGYSYWLGRRYQRAILLRWPFSHYPQIAQRSEQFFQRHGAKSVALGRFVPALRAFVPLFAGILNMPVRRFYISNVLSALAWGPAHVLPGVVLGASLSLAGAVAGRLGMLMLTILALLWLVVRGVRAGAGWGLPRLRRAGEALRGWAQGRSGWLGRQLQALLDPAESETKALVFSAVLLACLIWLMLAALEDIGSGEPLLRMDMAVFGALQGLRTAIGDRLMIAVSEMGEAPVVWSVSLAVFLWLCWRKAWPAAMYWLVAIVFASAFSSATTAALTQAPPIEHVYAGILAFSSSSGHTTTNGVLYGFLALLLMPQLAPAWRPWVSGIVTFFVLLLALARIYLGALWLSDVLVGLGFALAWITLLSLASRHHRSVDLWPRRLGALVLGLILLVGGATVYDRYPADSARFTPRRDMQLLAMDSWWAGDQGTLPVYRLDLWGEFEEPFTIEWAGDLGSISDELRAQGWRDPAPWNGRALLAWLTPNLAAMDLPVAPLLHDGRAPSLILVHPGPAGSRFVLRLWQSDVDLTAGSAPALPLWIGAVREERLHRPLPLVTVSLSQDEVNTPRESLAGLGRESRLLQRNPAAAGAFWDGGVLLLR